MYVNFTIRAVLRTIITQVSFYLALTGEYAPPARFPIPRPSGGLPWATASVFCEPVTPVLSSLEP